MSILTVIKLYALSTLVFFAVDIVWIGVVAKNFYAKNLGDLLTDKVNWAAALAFYLLYVAGLVYFAVLPALEKGSVGKAAFAGAFFGLVCYATYDLTNLATTRDWPWIVSAVDLCWGTVLGLVVATSGFYLGRWLEGEPT